MSLHPYRSPSPFASESVDAIAAFATNDPASPIEHLPIIRISETRAIVAHLPIRARRYHFADVISISIDRAGTIIAQTIDRPSTIEHIHGQFSIDRAFERSRTIEELEALGALIATNADGQTTIAIDDDAISTKNDIVRCLSAMQTWTFTNR